MKKNPLKTKNCRVNFSYSTSPSKLHDAQDNSSLIALDRITSLNDDSDQFYITINNNHSFESNRHSILVTAPQTIRKDVIPLPGATLRKSFKKKDRLDFGEQADLVSLDEQSQLGSFKANQTMILKEEIKYLRKKLIEAQNAEKELRLQFQLYKAGQEQITDQHQTNDRSKKEKSSTNYSPNNISKQTQLSSQNKQLQFKIKEQIKIIRALQTDRTTTQTENNNLRKKNNDINRHKERKDTLKEENAFLKTKLRQSDKKNHQLFTQINDINYKFTQSRQNVCTLQDKVHKLQKLIEIHQLIQEQSLQKLKSQQSNHCDSQYKQNHKQIKRQIPQKKITNQHTQLITQGQHSMEVIQLRSRNKQLQVSTQRLLENQRVLISELQFFRNKVKKENQEVQLAKNQQIHNLQLKVNKLIKQNTEIEKQNKQNIHSIINQYNQKISENRQMLQQQYKFIFNHSQNQNQHPKIEAISLSSGELSEHLQCLKNNQPEQKQEEIIQLQNQINSLKYELQSTKLASEQNLKILKTKYEKQRNQDEEEHNYQINIYMKEVQILVEEIDKLKGNKFFCQVIAEQNEGEQQSQISDQKIKRDIITYSADASDYLYISPPSNMHHEYSPIQNLSNNENSLQIREDNYTLQDIIDLDSKINNYINNFNSKDANQTIHEQSYSQPQDW